MPKRLSVLLWLACVLVVAIAFVGWFSFGPVGLEAPTVSLQIVSSAERILPTTSPSANRVMAPIAWSRSLGSGVTATVLHVPGTKAIDLAAFNSVAPAAQLQVVEQGGASAAAFSSMVAATRSDLLIIPFPFLLDRIWLEMVAKQLLQQGIAIFASAVIPPDNEGTQLINKLASVGAITVGGTDWAGTVTDPSAPDRVISVYSLIDTSPADPVLSAGAVGALVLAQNPRLAPKELKKRLEETATLLWQITHPQGRQQFFYRDREGHTFPRWTFFQRPFTFRQLNSAAAVGVTLEAPWFLNALGISEAQKSATGKGQLIAVIDHGFVLENKTVQEHLVGKKAFGTPDLADFVEPHGSKMSEIALAVAPEAELLAVLAARSESNEEMGARIADGIEYAVSQGAVVVSLSLATVDTISLNKAIDEAIAAGTSVVWINYQGTNPAVIRPEPIGVPGGDINVFAETLPGQEPAGTRLGRSDAAPQVAGAIALLKQVHPSWTPTQIKERLLQTADRLDANTLLLNVAAATASCEACSNPQ